MKYKLSAKVGKNEYKAEGNDLKQMILDMGVEIRKNKFGEKFGVYLESEGKKSEILLFPIEGRRFFMFPLSAMFLAKRLLMKLK